MSLSDSEIKALRMEFINEKQLDVGLLRLKNHIEGMVDSKTHDILLAVKKLYGEFASKKEVQTEIEKLDQLIAKLLTALLTANPLPKETVNE